MASLIAIGAIIGDLPVGAGGAAAPPDKETNFSTRNQKLRKKLFHTRMP